MATNRDHSGVTSLNIGGATNYTEVKSDGEINLHGTARVTKALWIGASAVRAPPTQPAVFVDHGIAGAWQFSDAAEDSIVAVMKIPSDMDITAAPTVSVGWSANGSSPGNCEWQVEYLWLALNEDTTAAAQGTLTDTSAASATSDGLVISTVTLAAPGSSDHCLQLRIRRLADNGNDTIADDVELHGICMNYTVSKLGTAT